MKSQLPLFRFGFTIAAVFLLLMIVPTVFSSVEAATLKFDKTTFTLNPGSTVDLQVMVDAGSDQILGVDSYVAYDPAYFEPQNVTNGTFFPTVLNNTFSGKVYLAGIVNDPATFKTGSGTLATVTFKALKNGTGTLSFYCVDGANDSSKILKNDTNATNVIQCANNGNASYTIGSGAAPTTAPGAATTAPVTAAPTISSLPKTGFADSMNHVGLTGAVLLLIGIGVKVLVL